MPRRLFVTLAAWLVLGGCSRDGSDPTFPDPDTVAFEYGSPTDASGRPAPAAVTSAAATVRSLVGLSDATPTPQSLVALVLLPGLLDQGAGWDPHLANLEPCFESTATTMRWNECDVEWSGTGFHHATLSGTLTHSATSITWDASMDVSVSNGKYRSVERRRLHGDLRVRVDDITGSVQSDDLVHSYAPGGADEGTITRTTHVALALTVDVNGCPVGGSVETKILSPDSQSGALYTWSGCGTVNGAAASR